MEYVIGGLVGGIAVALVFGLVLRNVNSAKASAEIRAERVGAERDQLSRSLEQRESEVKELRDAVDSAKTEATRASTELGQALRNVEEQKELLERARTELKDAFASLSAEALQQNRDAFLSLATGTLQTELEKGRASIAEQRAAVSNLVDPLKEAVARIGAELAKAEEGRTRSFGALDQQLRAVGEANDALREETRTLVDALRRPHVSGKWGEITLHRVVELAGLCPHCDFTEQQTIDTEDGKMRPDMTIHLPQGAEIVVDSKAPVQAFLDALSAPDDEARRQLLAKYAEAIASHAKQLGSKRYWAQFPKSPDVVVMFVQGEAFLYAALSVRPDLIETALQDRVLIACPTNLLALLRTVALVWQQEQILANANEIADTARTLVDRLSTFQGHLGDLGKALARATDAYNKASRSWETRILPQGRRVTELGATRGEETLSELAPVEQVPLGEALRELPDGQHEKEGLPAAEAGIPYEDARPIPLPRAPQE